jgi:predicted negative regulator of RcsB-dependent stress response
MIVLIVLGCIAWVVWAVWEHKQASEIEHKRAAAAIR